MRAVATDREACAALARPGTEAAAGTDSGLWKRFSVHPWRRRRDSPKKPAAACLRESRTFRKRSGNRETAHRDPAWMPGPPVSADPAPPDPAGLSSCMILLHDPAGQSSRTIQTLHNPDAAQSSSSCMKRPVSSTPCLWKRQGAFLSAVVCPLLQSLPFPDSPCQRTGTGRLLVPESVPWSAIPKQACPLSGKWSQGPRLMPGRPGASAVGRQRGS